VRSGANILIVSDRKVDAEHVAIPALLATSAIHQHLVKKGLRTSAGLVVETGSAREVHHFALLGGYGAEAVHPYLALETIEALAKGDAEKAEKFVKNFIKAIGKGLNKVMSKMGISTYMSYTGAQIFEAIGLQKELRREVLHRHAVQHRGYRCLRSGRRSHSPAQRSLLGRSGARHHA
jgi:glutamate synthase (NADPH/NADH) large chain